jgi:LPS sulfotransferase NodH
VLRGGLELPDRLIILRRRNHIAQAISLYFSNMTAVSHCSDERSLGEWTSLPVAWDAGEALSCLEQVRNWDRALAELNGLPVYYEDLLRHPLATVSYCYGYMGTAIALADRPMRELLTVPLQRLRTTQKSEFCGKLRALVAD